MLLSRQWETIYKKYIVINTYIVPPHGPWFGAHVYCMIRMHACMHAYIYIYSMRTPEKFNQHMPQARGQATTKRRCQSSRRRAVGKGNRELLKHDRKLNFPGRVWRSAQRFVTSCQTAICDLGLRKQKVSQLLASFAVLSVSVNGSVDFEQGACKQREVGL